MTESEKKEGIEFAKDFLCGYRLCREMLGLRQEERRRLPRLEDEGDCADILAGDEAYWRVRMYEVESLLSGMKNGRERMLLYYRYVRGLSVERAANLIGVSRRTGYRIHERGLALAAILLRRRGIEG